MSVGTLRYTVVVRHPESGEAAALVRGEKVPDWAKDLVHKDDIEPDKTSAKRSTSSKTEK